MTTRWLTAVATTVAVVLLTAAPAGAGGAPQLKTDRSFVRPGEAVVLHEDHVTKESREWKGPYRAWLRWAAWQPLGVGPTPLPPPQVEVGSVLVERVNELIVRATLSFVMPQLPTGQYEVLVCNPGCRDRLGDLYPGSVYVGPGPPVWELPVSAPPPTAATTAPVASPPSSPQAELDHVAETVDARPAAPEALVEEPAAPELTWWPALAVCGVVVTGAVLALRRFRRRRPHVGSSISS